MATISELLFKAENGQLAMPDFQRGWVWKRRNVTEFLDSLYHEFPVGSIIVWPTNGADGRLLDCVIDGKQRLSTLYAVIRGSKPPWLKDHDESAWNLLFNLEEERFDVATRARLEDQRWVSVTKACGGTQWWFEQLNDMHWQSTEQAKYSQRISRLSGLPSKEIFVSRLPEKMAVADALRVFQIVNRAGTKVREGDLILGQLSLKWPEAREILEKRLGQWRANGFDVPVEWLLHSMAADLDNRMEYDALVEAEGGAVEECCTRIVHATEELQNLLRDQLGFDPSQITKFNMGLIPIVASRLRAGGSLGIEEDRRYLGWWLLGTLWRRWSSDTRNRVNEDLSVVNSDEGVDGLMRELKRRSEGLSLTPEHFAVKQSPSQNALRLMRIMTRRCGARSLGNGLGLAFEHVGDLAGLQIHHIFPRALLRKMGEPNKQIDQVANLSFIRHDDNLKLGAKAPVDYLLEYEDKNPGVLASQWIPKDRSLWKPDRYRDFLEARRRLLAQAANDFLSDLLGRPLKAF
ncbi:MAG: DUF262 domain-containing protein [Acidimicrobiaceae bacterium]|nr:DUF262 domain-containing protein [Acidimicrobiaceae bacterium]MYE76229.1 DUF262 domain-containing protein [Acidimicrobiaceae bacterium]MYJ41602.1 DUF262 domain-containing protein [Acidimicrobiaceae bacterium]